MMDEKVVQLEARILQLERDRLARGELVNLMPASVDMAQTRSASVPPNGDRLPAERESVGGGGQGLPWDQQVRRLQAEVDRLAQQQEAFNSRLSRFEERLAVQLAATEQTCNRLTDDAFATFQATAKQLESLHVRISALGLSVCLPSWPGWWLSMSIHASIDVGCICFFHLCVMCGCRAIIWARRPPCGCGPSDTRRGFAQEGPGRHPRHTHSESPTLTPNSQRGGSQAADLGSTTTEDHSHSSSDGESHRSPVCQPSHEGGASHGKGVLQPITDRQTRPASSTAQEACIGT